MKVGKFFVGRWRGKFWWRDFNERRLVEDFEKWVLWEVVEGPSYQILHCQIWPETPPGCTLSSMVNSAAEFDIVKSGTKTYILYK